MRVCSECGTRPVAQHPVGNVHPTYTRYAYPHCGKKGPSTKRDLNFNGNTGPSADTVAREDWDNANP